MKKTLLPHKCPVCNKWERLEYEYGEVREHKFIAIACKHCKYRVSYLIFDTVKVTRTVKRIIVFKFKHSHEYFSLEFPEIEIKE